MQTKKTPSQLRVESILSFERKVRHDELAMMDRAAAFMEKLPEDVLYLCGFASDWLQISSPTREQVETILRVLNAGKWHKKVCGNDTQKLDYEGVVDGVRVIIYSASPPPTCRIEEEQVYVPAHNFTKRTLVCH